MKVIYVPYPKNKLPELKLTVMRVESNVWWNLGFYKYHYLSSKLNKSAKCFLFKCNDSIAAFAAVLNQPSKGNPWGYRITRLVVLPSMQNLGLSTRIINFIGGMVKHFNSEAQLYLMTIHTKIGKYFERSSLWNPTSHNQRIRKDPTIEGNRYKNRLQRLSYAYRYDGEPKSGYDHLFLPIGELRKNKISKST